MKTFRSREALDRGWELFKSNKNILLFSTLIILGINGIQSGRTHESHVYSSFGLFFGLLMFVVANMLHIGWTKMLLKITDAEHTSLGEMVKHANLFIKYICVTILYILMVSVGMFFLVIPGVYLALKYMFAPIISIDQYLSIRDSFKESARITDGVKWKLLGFILILIGANILGAFVFLVGLLVSVPVTMLATIYLYRRLSSFTETTTETINPGVTSSEPIIIA